MIGQTISHYKILDKLGEGGMGIVYKAHDTKLDRMVALKFLPHHLVTHDAEQARFLQEARAASALNHPNVCTIYDIKEENNQQFIIMEFVDGTTIRLKLPIQKLQEAMSYAIQIGEALHEAHGKGIVHRDIKCENIMVNSKNQIKVMDFGLAKLKGSMKLTKTSSTVGTLAYMAPEQIQGGEVDARSDIFSFGVVLFEMLTGHMPFHGEHEAAIMYSILNEEPESVLKNRQDISAEIDRIIRRALEKDPADRYQHADDMVSELRRVQKSRSTQRVERGSSSRTEFETGQSAKVSRTTLGEIPTRPVDESTRRSGGKIPETDLIASPRTRESAPPVSRPVLGTGRTRQFVVLGVILVVLVAAVIGYISFFGRHQSIDSIAVLPFTNVGADPNTEYLSDGITESLINNLTKISLLRVVPRSTVFRFKGKDMDIQDIGSKLNVSAVLSGRITYRGQVLDVQVDLIDIKRESQLWGNRYQSSVTDILSLQQQITNDVSSRLGIGLSSETRENLTKRSTDNTQAYQLYLQGRYFWNKRNAASIQHAITYFNQAITFDSTFALAYAGLADCYIIQSQYAGIPTRITIPLTQTMARRALDLDNSLAEAHTTLAFSYFEQWKYEDAEREFKVAISLNPRYPTAYHWYNIMLVRTGRIDEASVIIRQGHELDPYSPIITLNAGAIPFIRRQYEEALPYFKKCIELDPSFAPGYAWAGLTYERMKNYQEALPQLQKALELYGRSSEALGYLGFFYGRIGKRDEALKLLKENEDRYHSGTGAAYNIARIYAGLGEKEKVLEWLEIDYNDRSIWINSLISDYTWDDVRSDPRFVKLTKKVGLVK